MEKKLTKKLEAFFTAVTFAEAGEPETARHIMQEELKEQKQDTRHSQKGIRMTISPSPAES